MKTIYKSTLLIVLGCITLGVSAQKDTLLSRQVMLERDYNPTLKDASKINITPSVYEPVVIKREANYVDKSPQVSLNNNLLGTVEAGEVKTDVNFDKRRGYLGVAAGTNSNIDAFAGFRILNGDKDKLDLFANHASTSGNVDYLDKGYWFDKAKAKYSDSKVNLKYAHTFDPSILSVDASYFNTSYNYYGNSFLPKSDDPDVLYPFNMNARQNVDVISFGAGIQSREDNPGLLRYAVTAGYKNFKNKYGPLVSDKGIKGGQFDLTADFSTDFGADKVLGVKGSLMSQSISDVKFAGSVPEDAFHSYLNFTGTPYINFIGASWDVSLGLNVNALFDVKTKFAVSPNINASVRFDDLNILYGKIGGGVNNNTVLDILQENRYADLSSRVAYSKTHYDLQIGFKSGILSGFEFDLFAGYKYTKDDHLYGMSSLGGGLRDWGNLAAPIYANLSTGHIGGSIKTSLIPYTDLSAKVVGYFYNVKYVDEAYRTGDTAIEKKAWGQPSFTAELNADVKVIPELTFSLNYLYAGGRKAISFLNHNAVLSNSAVHVAKMKDINELNVRAEYQLTNWAAVNVRANNILFQKYEKVYGYALQGFNFMGGLSFKF